MANGGEEWQTGFYVGSPTQDATVPTQAYADAVRNAWTTLWTDASMTISDSYTFTAVKCARLAKNGLYDGSDIAQSFPATAVVGGSGIGAPLPPQIALVATLIGGSGKGYGGKGRMYLPGIKQSVGTDGHIPQAFCQTVATKLAAFFNTIDASMDAPGHVINVSRGNSKLLGIGARNVYVNGVRVGNVYDTQRRRRNALAETYSAAVVND
jgi:hypothetical protein